MNNLSKLLEKIKHNPAIYIDKPSITCLHSFLIGYLSKRTDLGLDREGSGIEGFQEWIQERKKTNVSQSWAGIILFVCGSERTAFDRFFVEFEFFKNRPDPQPQQNPIEAKSRTSEHELRFRQFDIFNELLENVKKRPGMYLGTPSITRLDMLLRGDSLARSEVGELPTEAEKKFRGFQSWVEEKYGITSGQSWAKIILFYSIDEYEALFRFFELYEEYLNLISGSIIKMSELSTQ